VKEGMLTVTAHTHHAPLVIANLLTTTAEGVAPGVARKNGNGFQSGEISGKRFAFTTSPGNVYHIENMETDALAMTWSAERIFVAMATIFKKEGHLILKSDAPVTFELSADSLKYYRSEAGELIVGARSKPSAVMLNDQLVKNFIYDKKNNVVIIKVPKGQGIIIIK